MEGLEERAASKIVGRSAAGLPESSSDEDLQRIVHETTKAEPRPCVGPCGGASLSDQGLTNRDAPSAAKPQTLVGMKVGTMAEKPENEDEGTG